MGTLKNTLASAQGKRVYFDTNAFIYFFERNDALFEKAAPWFQSVEEGAIVGICGDLVVAELLVKPMSTNDSFGITRIRTTFDDHSYFTVVAHDRDMLELAAHIRATQKIAMIDAIHLATAIKSGCSFIITNDEKVAKRAQGITVIRLVELDA